MSAGNICGVEISQLPIIPIGTPIYSDSEKLKSDNFNTFLEQLREIPKKALAYLFLKILLLLNITEIIFIFIPRGLVYGKITEFIDVSVNKLIDELIERGLEAEKQKLEFITQLLRLFNIGLCIRISEEVYDNIF